MKVRCIENKSNPASLTVGKVYTAKREGEYYRLVDDFKDGMYLYPVEWFKEVKKNGSDISRLRRHS